MAARDDIEILLEDLEPRAARELRDALRDVTDSAVLTDVEKYLRAGDVESAIAAIQADSVAFNAAAYAALGAVFVASGAAVAALLPRLRTPAGLRIVPRFDERSQQARAWLDSALQSFSTRMTAEIETVLRTTFEEGLAAGRSPRQLTLDAVGRISRARVRREGGLIGLTPQLAAHARAARDELASGDPARMRKYLTRALRDSRFDGTVQRAIDEGRALTSADVDRLTGRYASKLLDYRSRVLIGTEMRDAAHAGQAEMMRQVISTGAVPPEQVVKTWVTSGLPNTRDSHAMLSGRTIGWEQAFNAPGGRLAHPGDRSLGASASEWMNCRCHAVYRLRYMAASGRVGRLKVG